LAVFGGTAGLGVAGGGQGAISPDSGGDLVGGGNNMPAPFKVGERTWKGPLSVRSSVPAEDGNTFIQTDAGPSGDLFASHHYNGSWTKKGLEASEATIDRDVSLNDSSTSPSSNGEVRRNGGDVLVYSGGSSRNLSNVGSGGTGVTQIATGTVTASGGSIPAVQTTITNISTDDDLDYWVALYPDADPTLAADYAFNFDYSHIWDNSAGAWDLDLTVNWDLDPGSGNDVTLRWEVLQ